MNKAKIALAGAALLAASPFSTASADTFSVLTYNVRGLPAAVIEDRTAEIAAIAPLLEDFHNAGGTIDGIAGIVEIQELFDAGYYATITDGGTVSYPNITAKDNGGFSGIGDGLTLMSDFSFAGFTRTQWNMCFGSFGADGSDCDTNKGYSFAQVTLGPGAIVHVYNLHADAGQDEGSRAARRDNITQLTAAINANSAPGTAVIVMGDTNSHYTRTPNDNIETILSGAGLTDVWVELVNGGVVPGAGPDNESGCDTAPSGANCELIDKIFYRSGSDVVLTPMSYTVYKDEFSDMSGDLSDHLPVSAVFDYMLVNGSTTTTTTSTTMGGSTTTSTTSTTMPPTTSSTTTTSVTVTTSSTTTTTLGETSCGDPIPDPPASGVAAVTASDALFILNAAIGARQCELCVCDVNDSGGITATDALAVLNAAVGQPVPLVCPDC